MLKTGLFLGLLIAATAFILLETKSVDENNLCFRELEQMNFADTKYLITPDSSLVFSIDSGSAFRMYKYKSNKIESLFPGLENVFSPFIYDGHIAALKDDLGNEDYHVTDKRLSALFSNKSVKDIYSSSRGNHFVVRFKSDNAVYVFNTKANTIIPLFNVSDRLHSVTFSEDGNNALISYDNHLICYSFPERTAKELAADIKSTKYNPCWSKNTVLFASNHESEFYRIYKIDLKSKIRTPKLVHSSDHDLRLPKLKGSNLYIVEIINNQYLLKSKNLITSNIEVITNSGVVYNYDFIGDHKIIAFYSSFNRPNSVFEYDVISKSKRFICGSDLKVSGSFEFVQKTDSLSSAYIYKPKAGCWVKGVIIFIHPGLHSDFSPRWDAILNSLTELGFIIVAPNYPMSFGYGKTFSQKDYSMAVNDIIKWKNTISKCYHGYQISMLTASSGNMLMESCMERDYSGISHCASLFGMSGNVSTPCVPSLFILGKNDPFIDCSIRSAFLANCPDTKLYIYDDEGHWFRKTDNLKDCIQKVNGFFN